MHQREEETRIQSGHDTQPAPTRTSLGQRMPQRPARSGTATWTAAQKRPTMPLTYATYHVLLLLCLLGEEKARRHAISSTAARTFAPMHLCTSSLVAYAQGPFLEALPNSRHRITRSGDPRQATACQALCLSCKPPTTLCAVVSLFQTLSLALPGKQQHLNHYIILYPPQPLSVQTSRLSSLMT